jgi:hypothetical protein
MERQDIDRFLSESVDKASIEFQEAHWQHALRALEKDEEDKKGLLWWYKNKFLLTAALVLLSFLSIVGYHQFAQKPITQNQESQSVEATQSPIATTNENSEIADEEIPSTQRNNPVEQNTNGEVLQQDQSNSEEGTQSSSASTYRLEDRTTETNKSVKLPSETASKSITSSKHQVEKKAEENSPIAYTNPNPVSNLKATSDDHLKKGNTENKTVKNNIEQNVTTPQAKVVNKPNEVKIKNNEKQVSDNQKLETEKNIVRADHTTSTQAANQVDNEKSKSRVASSTEQVQEEIKDNEPAQAIQPITNKVETTINSTSSIANNENAQNNATGKDNAVSNKISFDTDPPSTIKSRYTQPEKKGLGVQVAAAVTQSLLNGAQSSTSYQVSPWLGLSYHRLLMNKLSWRAGLGFTYIQGLENPYKVVRYNYGLVANHQTFHIQSQSIMQIGVPMSLAYALTQRASLNLGAAVNYNASVLSKVKDFNNSQYVNRWGYTQPYNLLQGYALAGGQFNINPLLAIQLQMMYGLGDVTKNNFQQIQNKDQAHRILIGLRYHIK